ncbi:MAG: ATP-binding cassette domain-containing protein [Candidatus Latescibacteria bacterium]|nr:ATP-binding cassette domain-containing protein [Candidatus Latescibacterota bacterium]
MSQILSASRPAAPVLKVEELCTSFATNAGPVRAVDGVSFALSEGQTLGLVGESGCGKSVTALSVMRLISDPPGKIESGRVLLGQRDLLQLSEADMCQVRGDDVAMIFQEPMTSLNPVLTCGYQIAEAVRLHQGLSKSAAMECAVEMLRLVGIPAPQQRLHEYPHQLSGGMRQRIMIAMGLSCKPQVLIADEPTTALDVTVQAQILELLAGLQGELGMALLLITHDLGVVAQVADRVAVMYSGRIVESGATQALFAAPRHPYTQGLMRAIPRLDIDLPRLEIIPGSVPDLRDRPQGCPFHPRCPLADEGCREAVPPLAGVDSDHQVACWKADD